MGREEGGDGERRVERGSERGGSGRKGREEGMGRREGERSAHVDMEKVEEEDG